MVQGPGTINGFSTALTAQALFALVVLSQTGVAASAAEPFTLEADDGYRGITHVWRLPRKMTEQSARAEIAW